MKHRLPGGWLLLTVVLGAAQAAGAQTTFVLETEAAYQISFNSQYTPVVCAGPGEYFSVWRDVRHKAAIFGQRILPDGTTIHPGSNELLKEPFRSPVGVPAVAWSGSVYLVAWCEDWNKLYGMRVTADGEVLDPGGFLLDERPNQHGWPSIASDGDGFLVVHGAGATVYAQRVGADGTLLDSPPITVSTGSAIGYPKAAFGAGVYMIAWPQAPELTIRAARVTPGGQVLDPGGVHISGGGFDVDPNIGFDGANFYVSWQRKADGLFWDLWGVHVSPQVEPGTANMVLNGATFQPFAGGQMAFNGTDYIIALTIGEPVYSNYDLWAIMVDSNGVAKGPPFAVSTLPGRSQVGFGAASLGDQFFISWEGNILAGFQWLYSAEGARIDAAGKVLDKPAPVNVSGGATWQILGSTSFDGENFLSVFEDWREGQPNYRPDIYGVRVTPAGVPLDGAAIKIGGILSLVDESPDSVYGGGVHAVVYVRRSGSGSEVRLARVLPDGTNLDPSGIVVFKNQSTGEVYFPKIAWNGSTFLVLWYDGYLQQGETPLQYARVNPDGTVAQGATNVAGSSGVGVHGFDAGASGDEFLIAWEGSGSVKASRVSAAGQQLGTATVASTGDWTTERVRVAFNGEGYLVGWTRGGPTGPATYARPVSLAGAPHGEVVTVDGPASVNASVAIEAHGPEFVFFGLRRQYMAPYNEIYAARLDTGGTIVAPAETIFSPHVDDAMGGPSFAIGNDRAMMTISLWASNPFNAARAHGLMIELGSDPGDCYADFDGDGSLTLFDFLAFTNAFNQGSDAADCDGSGAFSLFDFLCFTNAFNQGC